MVNLPILESFFDKEIVAGYSLKSIFEYWWIGLIIIIVAAVGLVGTYFLLSWLFGRMKFKEGDKEELDKYSKAPKEEKKAVAKASTGAVRNVITWRRIRGWLIPVVCVAALIGSAAASFLPSAAFANLMFTLRGSHVDIIDTETSRQAAAEAEKNVVTIQEEGTVLLKNSKKALPLNLEENKKVNIFGSCAYGLFYGNGGSGSFQTDGRVKGFPRVALKLEQAMKDEGFEINENLFNMIKNYYSSNKKTISVAQSDYDIQCGFNKYGYAEIVSSKAPYDYEPPVSAYNTPFDELGGKTLLENAKEFSDTAIFCITRRGSEDEDMKIGDLQLKANELAAIDMLEDNFEKVIILLNVPTVMETEFLDDPKWDDYMNQFTKAKMVEMVTNGGWNEKADPENGVPESYDADSPYGYYAAALSIKNINKWYCGDPMVAATFNEKLARELGEAFGEEAHANYLAGGSLIAGIYGYGLNMHRSAFGGRNYEYYSEDGVLAGKMAASEAGGASEKGLIVFMKHYALNDQETNRQKNGYCAWVNEQAFREVYLKGWELYMKEAKMTVKYYAQEGDKLASTMSEKTMSAATGIMTCYNRIGATWGGASVSLHGILRDEFGFTGTAITDAGGQKNTYMTSDFMLRRGGHLTLTNNGSDGLYDTSSPTAVYYLKDATKHILFNKANSNCVQGLSPSASIWYDMSPWKGGLIAAWVVVGILALADAAFITLIALNKVQVKERKEPEEEY